MASCQLTHVPRVPIDLGLAREQHRAYELALANAGYQVERIVDGPGVGADMPDRVFVEDIAVVFDELAIVTRPGAESRRAEVPAVADVLGRYRPLRFIDAPGTVDGGDVLLAGRRVFVGRSSRTNEAGILQLRRFLGPLGYTVCDLEVGGCLHLKSAVTSLAGDLLLVNPQWVDASTFVGFVCVEVDPLEPSAANALQLDDRVLVPASFPRTADRLAARGLRVQTVDASEVAKAEGAVTCCSLIVPSVGPSSADGGPGRQSSSSATVRRHSRSVFNGREARVATAHGRDCGVSGR
jgi:dimethylargininase